MKGIGKMVKEMEMENILIKMVNIILANLKMIYQMEKELNITQMEILNMKVIGKMIKKKGMENFF